MPLNLAVLHPQGLVRRINSARKKHHVGRQCDTVERSKGFALFAKKAASPIGRVKDRAAAAAAPAGLRCSSTTAPIQTQTPLDCGCSQRIEQLEQEVAAIRALLSEHISSASQIESAHRSPVQLESVAVQTNIDTSPTVGKSSSPVPLEDGYLEERSLSPTTSTPDNCDGDTSYGSTDKTPDLTFDHPTDVSYSASSMDDDDFPVLAVLNAAELTCARTAGMHHPHDHLGTESADCGIVEEHDASLDHGSPFELEHLPSLRKHVIWDEDVVDDRSDVSSDSASILSESDSISSGLLDAIDELLEELRNAPERRPTLLDRRPSFETLSLVQAREKRIRKEEYARLRRSLEAEDLDVHYERMCVRRPTVAGYYYQRASYHLLPVATPFPPHPNSRRLPKSMKASYKCGLPALEDDLPPEYTPSPDNSLPPAYAVTEEMVKRVKALAPASAGPKAISMTQFFELLDILQAGKPLPIFAIGCCEVIHQPRTKRVANWRNIYLKAGCDGTPPAKRATDVLDRAAAFNCIVPLRVVGIYDVGEPIDEQDMLHRQVFNMAFRMQPADYQATGMVLAGTYLAHAEQIVRREVQREQDADEAPAQLLSIEELQRKLLSEQWRPPSCVPSELIDPDTGCIMDPGSSPSPILPAQPLVEPSAPLPVCYYTPPPSIEPPVHWIGTQLLSSLDDC
ncbi:hypothetical protein EV122DRAFT_274989 [Schizophyllum commune]